MEQIFMARSVCEHCNKEYLIEDGAPVGKRKPHSVRNTAWFSGAEGSWRRLTRSLPTR